MTPAPTSSRQKIYRCPPHRHGCQPMRTVRGRRCGSTIHTGLVVPQISPPSRTLRRRGSVATDSVARATKKATYGHVPRMAQELRCLSSPAQSSPGIYFFISTCGVPDVGRSADQLVQAAGSYSLVRPPRTCRRRTLPWNGSGIGNSGRGGRSCRLDAAAACCSARRTRPGPGGGAARRRSASGRSARCSPATERRGRSVNGCHKGGDFGFYVVDESGQQQYVALLIDPSSEEIEAYGPADELNAVLLAEELRVALATDAELQEVGVLILPLQPSAARFVAAPEPPTTG